MGSASKYWKFISIDGAGKRKTEEIPSAKAFFRQQFPELAALIDVPDAQVQRQLLHWARAKSPDSDALHPAQICLRCFISSLIEQVCIQLEASFGSNYGFTRQDLFPFVLDDFSIGCDDANTPQQVPGRSQPSSYQSLATQILQTFEPERGSLSTWTTRLVKHHRELNVFLLQHGVYLVSDWAILNDTNPKQLQRIFSQLYHLTPVEIQQASLLLESYHAVYRRDRLAARGAGIKGQCPSPTLEQLRQIAHRLHVNAQLMLSPEEVMNQLQDITELLRQYRIYVRGGAPPTESLDNPLQTGGEVLQIPSPDSEDDEDMQTEFLRSYRRQFIDCLDQALEKVIGDRVTHPQRKRADSVQKFITALHFFHCQGKSMGEIAPLVGLQHQFQVTRLLKLKEFRADVRQVMINTLLHSVLKQAIPYTDPNRLQTLDRQIEIALNEQIELVIQEAEVECSTPKKSARSLFSKRLCRHLNRNFRF